MTQYELYEKYNDRFIVTFIMPKAGERAKTYLKDNIKNIYVHEFDQGYFNMYTDYIECDTILTEYIINERDNKINQIIK